MLETKRLILRNWREEDRSFLFSMARDPEIRQFFPSILDARQSDILFDKFCSHFAAYGFGYWVACLKNTQEPIGYMGLLHVDFAAHFTPAIEIGWSLVRSYWNKGYATEGAKGILKYGFTNLHLQEIVSFCSKENERSRKVMEKIGMHTDKQEDFIHPKCPVDFKYKKHVLYRITFEQWNQSNQTEKNSKIFGLS